MAAAMRSLHRQTLSFRRGNGVKQRLIALSPIYVAPIFQPAPKNSLLWLALVFSVILHLTLSVVQFRAPEMTPDSFATSSLEVILMNAATEESATNARLLAQVDVAGGGEAFSSDMYATLPSKYAVDESVGDSSILNIADERRLQTELVREVEQIKEEFSMLLAAQEQQWAANNTRRAAEEVKRQLLTDKIAAIEQKIQEESSRPHRIYIGPATRRHAQAVYYDTIRRKIELRGTENFPQHQGKPMYGALLMEVSIDTKGRLQNTAVLESSRHSLLDRQAQAIVSSAGPFPAAPAELLVAGANIEFVFIMRFKFMNDGTVQTQLQEKRDLLRE